MRLDNIILVNYSFADIFAIPVSLFATRRKHYIGSIPGFILTSILVSMILFYIGFQIESMINCEKDKYDS